MNLGFRILQRDRKASEELVSKFRDIPTTVISDCMNRMFSGGAHLRPFHNNGKLLGTALTVKTRPGDNLMVHKAIQLAEPGDVIVVDGGGEVTHAMIGEIMMRLAMKQGVNGFVINGAIRDSGVIAKESFPVYAKAVTHRGPYKDGPGEINVPISIAEMVIHPGDIVIGDEDGVVAVRPDHAEEIVKLAKERMLNEIEILASIDNGSYDGSAVDVLLRTKGCEGVD
ncbi:RraA family protein [Bacillus suaedaesalsae]|uniref:Putative 4-hydroxy-4-methyl-2-oxoglutarate aldolase n=1 Tax=Bacillus suaedaesalsae TaxID=2810349 RepID=A0ABS2DIR5_9BACI|nr:RraA family protein [Bacillus suaedaesalsae]MBM6617880.1 RraA family protein [Bacillus suaedaesalsae]